LKPEAGAGGDARAAERAKRLGAWGERAALGALRKERYHIWRLNWRARGGELDIIATEGPVLVFVEVKTRSGRAAQAFAPADAVDEAKARRMKRAAGDFIRAHEVEIKRRRLRSYRFDIVTVTLARGNGQEVLHLKDVLSWD